MKKLAAAIIVAFALCVVAAVAQTATDPSQGTQGAPPSASQPSTPSQQQPGQQQPGYGQPGTATGQTDQTNNNSAAPAEKVEKKMRGCIQSQGGQYLLEGKKGKAVALTGQDVSAHVGHEVSVKGTWETGGTGVSSGAASAKTFNVTSVEMISDTCGGKSSKGNSGSMGTSSPGNSSPSGTGSTSNPPQ